MFIVLSVLVSSSSRFERSIWIGLCRVRKKFKSKRISESGLSKDSFHNNSILWFAGEICRTRSGRSSWRNFSTYLAGSSQLSATRLNGVQTRLFFDQQSKRTEWYHLINSKHRSKIVPKRNKNLNDLDYQPQDAIRRSTTSKLHMVTNDGNYTARMEMLHIILMTPILL